MMDLHEISSGAAGSVITASVIAVGTLLIKAYQAWSRSRREDLTIEAKIEQDGLEKVVAHLSREFEAAKKEHALELAEMREEVRVVRAENAQLRADHVSCQLENERMKSELRYTNQRVTELQSQLDAHREKHRKPGEPETTLPQPSPLTQKQ